MDLKQLAKDIVNNLVFVSHQVREFDRQNLGMIFMPIMFGAFDKMSAEERADSGVIYEYYKEAAPRGVNGYPIFFSCHYLNMADWKVVCEYIETLQKAMDAL